MLGHVWPGSAPFRAILFSKGFLGSSLLSKRHCELYNDTKVRQESIDYPEHPADFKSLYLS